MIIEQLSNNSKTTQTEKQLIDFILAYPRIAVNLSLEALSQECFVSQASVIRFCKKLGMKGFSEFKIQLASELSAFALDGRQIPVDVPISPADTQKDIAETFYNLSHQALDNTYKNLDYDAVEKAAALLANADLVRVYGRGESLILAEDFHYKMIRIGKTSVLETLNGFQEASSIHFKERGNEAALVISQYCNSRQVNYIIDELMSTNIPYVLLTAAQRAWPYDRLAEVTLRISCTESRHKIGSFASRTAMLYTLDCLFGQIFALNYEENRDNLARISKRKLERDYFYRSSDDAAQK